MPDLGITTIGPSSFSQSADVFDSTIITPPSDGEISSITLYCAAGVAANFKGVLVRASDKAIIGVATAVAIPIITPAWTTSTFSSPVAVVGSTNYYAGMVASGAFNEWYTDDAGIGTTAELYDGSNSYTTPTNPTDGSTFNDGVSIYATFTSTAGADTPELRGRPYGQRGDRQMRQILVL